MELLGIVTTVVGGITTIIGSVLVLKSKTLAATVDEQKNLITTLQASKGEQKEQIEKLSQDHTVHTTEIAELRGQVSVLRDVPLQNIASELNSIRNVGEETLKLIKNKKVEA